MNNFVTVAVGFIGRSIVERLTRLSHNFICIDNINDYSDVYQTYVEVEVGFEATGYKTKFSVKNGVAEFVKWYREFDEK